MNPELRLTADQRKRLEELEEEREAQRLQDLARQRAELDVWDEDRYVAQRMEREREAIAADIRQAEAEIALETGGAPDQNVGRLVLFGVLLTIGLLAMSWLGRP